MLRWFWGRCGCLPFHVTLSLLCILPLWIQQKQQQRNPLCADIFHLFVSFHSIINYFVFFLHTPDCQITRRENQIFINKQYNKQRIHKFTIFFFLEKHTTEERRNGMKRDKVQWKQKNERKRSRAVAVAVSHVRVSESRLFNHWTDKMRFKCFSLFLRRFFGNGIIISSIICNRFQCTDNTIIITKLTGFCSPHSSSPIAGFHLLKSETSTRF